MMSAIKPVLGQKPKSALKVFVDLYSAQITFRGFVDFSVIGALALIFLNGIPSQKPAAPTPPATAALNTSKKNPGLAALATPPDFGRNSYLAPRLSELGLREDMFSQVTEPLRSKLVASWRIYRDKRPEGALDLLAGADGENRSVLLLKGLASIAISEEGAFPRGLGFLEKSSAKGEPKATAVLGVLKIAGVPGLQRDLEAGQKLLLKASTSGDYDISRVVAEGLLSGWMGSIDAARAAAYLKPGALNGEPKSAYRLAELTIAGRGVPRDDVEADRLLKLSAEQGNAEAMTMLGFRMLTPFLAGITDDPSQALAWLKRSADKGQAEGMLLLGTYYTEYAKRIGAIDYQKGFEFFRLCVEQTSNAECAFPYATALDRGMGGQRDVEYILALFLVASFKNDTIAVKTKIDDLIKEMTPEGVAKARGRAVIMMAKSSDRGPHK